MTKYCVVRGADGCEPAPYVRFVGTLHQCKSFINHELAIATAGGDWNYEYYIKEYND